MRIVLATPLFPPDIGEAADYAKEAAKRLSMTNTVTVVLYGDLPESVEGVRLVSISKKIPRLRRLYRFTKTLIAEARGADVVYAQNGASVEVPAAIAALFVHAPVILHIADTAARERSERSLVLRIIWSIARKHAKKVIDDMPLPKPEILPYARPPEDALTEYEGSWKKHLGVLTEAFSNG